MKSVSVFPLATRRTVLLFLSLLLGSGALSAELTHKSSWPGFARGPVTRLRAMGDRLYTHSEEAGLRILDVSDPARPRVLGALPNIGEANSLEFENDHLYLVRGYSSTRVINVRNPSAPVRVGEFGNGEIFYLRVRNGTGYSLEATVSGVTEITFLRLRDLRDPRRPELLGSLPVAGSPQGLGVHGHFVTTVSSPDVLRVIDVSIPSAPRVVGTYKAGGVSVLSIVHETRAYLQTPVGVEIVDLADPAAPRRVGMVQATSGRADLCFARGNLLGLQRWGTGLEIHDVADPATPRLVGSFPAPTLYGNSDGGPGDPLWLAAASEGALALDVRDPARPVPVGSYRSAGNAVHVEVNGTRAYLSDGEAGLRILDVSRPEAPRELGTISGFTAVACAVEGKHAYLAAARDGLRIFDVADPEHPREVGSYVSADTIDTTTALVRHGHHVYLATITDYPPGGTPRITGTLHVIDVSDPSRPVLRRRMDGIDHFGKLWVRRGLLHAGLPAFEILSLADPANPVRVSRPPVSEAYYDLAVSRSLAYGVSQGGFLYRTDLHDPAAPKSLGYLTPPVPDAGAIALGERYGVLGAASGIYLMDFVDPLQPVRLGRVAAPWWPNRLVLSGRHVFATEGPHGLQILELNGEPTASSELRLTPTGDASKGFRLAWPGSAGQSYRVRSATTWPPENFETMAEGVPAAPPETGWTAPLLADPARFFRVETE